MAPLAVEERVLQLIAELTKREQEEISLQHSLSDDLALDSINFLSFLSTLEEEFQFELEVDDLDPLAFRTVEACIHFVQKRVRG